MNSKDFYTKETFQGKYKENRHMLFTLLKRSKMNYFIQYFEGKCQIYLKRIKYIISFNNVWSNKPKTTTITNSVETANCF